MLSRRGFISLGTRGVAAYTVANSLVGCETLAQQAVTPKGTAKTCILVLMMGGPTHLETWDAKEGPWTARDFDIREYGGGVTMSNRSFPMLSRNARDLALLRSVEAWDAAHDRAQYYLWTSYARNPAFQRERPGIGAVVAYEGKSTRRSSDVLPGFIALNGTSVGPGFLSAEFAPFNASSGGAGIATLQHPGGRDRFIRRYDFLRAMDADLRRDPYAREMEDLAAFYDSSRGLMYNDVVDSVFRFTNEERLRYGSSGFGNACLVARNIVKADIGTRFVTIVHGGWDQHIGLFDTNNPGNIYNLGRQFDSGIANLIEDLRGAAAPAGRVGNALANTLIVALGDFGRTPGNLNSRGGRDHYRVGQATLMVGGGVRGPRAIGATDATGARIANFGWSQERPIRMEDITATMYSALGINWTKSLGDTPSGKRYEYVQWASQGLYQPVNEVF